MQRSLGGSSVIIAGEGWGIRAVANNEVEYNRLLEGGEMTLGQRWFEEVWNRGRREAIAEMMAPEAPLHEGGQTAYGPAGFYPFFDRMHASFSDMHITIEDSLVAGDKECVRWSCTMKHTGEALGLPATGKALHITGISIVRVERGLLAEAWQSWDMLGLIHQIRDEKRMWTYIKA